MTCKGTCIRHKVSGRYVNGHKRCQHCNVIMKYEALNCPCCGCQLGARPTHFRYRAKWIEQKQIEVVYYPHTNALNRDRSLRLSSRQFFAIAILSPMGIATFI